MTWNPTQARTLLNISPLVCFIDERNKLSSFKTKSGQELALIEENSFKVSIYLSRIPYHMPMVTLDGIYEPNAYKKGRHSNLALITETLGFEYKAFKAHVKSEAALECLLEWYQYA